MTRRWIPFKLMPASWGLIGDAYQEADAYYNLEGEALERRLLDIRLRDHPLQWERETMEIDLRYGKISKYDAAIRRVNFQHPPGVALDLALLEIEYEHGNIDKNTYDKQHATLNNDPWICIVNSGFDPSSGVDGVFFEFDWNAHWIDYLRANGYSGRMDEQVIDDWFSDVCRNHSTSDPVPFNFVNRTE